VGGCAVHEKFSPFVDRLLLWRQAVYQSKKDVWQIALLHQPFLKSFENPKSFFSFFRILKSDSRRSIRQTEFWCLSGETSFFVDVRIANLVRMVLFEVSPHRRLKDFVATYGAWYVRGHYDAWNASRWSV